MWDKMLIDHCPPTLRGMKTASLFHYPHSSGDELDHAISIRNEELNTKGVSLHIPNKRKERTLIHVCRASMLADDLFGNF